MQYPNAFQYRDAVLKSDSFATLKNMVPIISDQEPIMVMGNSSVVFKMRQNGKHYALKCFTKNIDERNQRYKAIVNYLKTYPSKHFTKLKYFENELRIEKNKDYELPVVLMEWIDAPTLGEKIKKYCDDNNYQALEELAAQFRDFAVWLIDEPFAHGDLSHENLLIKDDNTFVMVDYDGMFIPYVFGNNAKAFECDSKAFQHPKLNIKCFNSGFDEFSIFIIYLSLRALAENPKLYNIYHNGNNIIFSQKTFIETEKSSLLATLSKSKYLCTKIGELQEICKSEELGIYGIVNIKQLIDQSISIYDFYGQLHDLEQTIEDDIDDFSYDESSELEMKFKSRVKLHSLFEKIYLSYQQIGYNKKNAINQEWWDNLSNDWKRLIMFNIETEIGDIKYHKLKFNTYKLPQQIEFNSIFFKICNMKAFVVSPGINLEPIRALTNLRKLSILSNRSNLSPITSLKKLTYLNLYKNIADLTPITALNLTALELKDSSADLSPIKDLYYLNHLYINPSKADLSPISSLTWLRRLILSHNEADLTPVSSLTNLIELNLYSNSADLSPISSLTGLKELHLKYNPSDLKPIHKLISHIRNNGGTVMGVPEMKIPLE